MNKEKYELSGRTMTEMLGVLAVIGVLSIGGVAGYSYAMDKYRANVTINDINLRAVDLITQA
ncbi:MAG: Tfp pilus assembly protein FimT/FimU, partial [Alphaproteobacteria bacterium]